MALALGGIFMVRYSIEQGLLGPGVRTFFGGLLAAALVAAGEWTRRNEIRAGFANLPTAHIPSILTAAGTTVAYATIYAAYALYGFIGPAGAFIMLGAVALATLAAALLHGPALAGLGLVGAYVTPLLVSTGQPSFWALYLYLAVVTAAAFTLARARLWRWLAVTAVLFGAFWAFPGLQNAADVSTAPHVFYAVVCFGLAAALIVSGLAFGPDAEPDAIDGISSLALGAFLTTAALVVIASWARHARARRLLAPRRRGRRHRLARAVEHARRAGGGRSGRAAVARVGGQDRLADPHRARRTDGRRRPRGGPGAFRTASRVRRRVRAVVRRCRVPGPGPLRAPADPADLGSLRGRNADRDPDRALLPHLRLRTLDPVRRARAAARRRLRGRDRSPDQARAATRTGTAAALYAVGTIASLALAFTLALEKGWLTVALALMVPGIAYVAQHRPVPFLRVLAAAVGVLVLVRVGYEPRIVGSDIGTTPIFNWILYGYGVPAAAFWLGGYLLRRQADDVPARTVESLAITFTVLLTTLEIRHYLYAGNIYREASGLIEIALQVAVWLAMAIGLERVRLRTQSVVHDIGALIVAALALLGIVFGLVLFENPLSTGEPVGNGFINLILLGYGLPAVLAIALALVARHTRPMPYRVVAAVTSVSLSILYLTLEVRRLFHGERLTLGVTTDAEWYAYSAVWLAYGVVLLLAGIFLRSQPARLASAAVIILTIAKVFLYDMAGLTGIYRALSFIGLGLVLVGIGYLYQRLLFPRRPPPNTSSETAPA